MPVQIPRWSMNQITSRNWPLERDFPLYRQLGVTAIGASVPKMRAHGMARAEAAIREAGFAVSVLGSLGPFDLRKDSLAAEIEETKALLGTAARIGASCVLVLSGNDPSRCWEEVAPRCRRVMEALLPEAERLKVRLALEHTHALRIESSFLHSLDESLDFVDTFDSPWLGVVMEVNNAWIEPRLYRNIAERVGRIFLVQVNDYRLGTMTTPERVVIGDGHIPLRRILHALLDAGYDGYYDIEIIGPEIEKEGYASVVPRSIKAFEALWSSPQ